MVENGAFSSFLGDVLSEARRVADHAEVFGALSQETPVRFEANRLKEIQGRSTRTVALRLVKGGRLGLSMSSGVTDPRTVVKMALETAPFGAEAKFEFPGRLGYPDVPVYDPEVEKVATEEMVQMGQQLIDRVRRHTPELLCEGGVSKSFSELFLANSNGASAHYRRSLFSAGVEGTLVRGEDMLFVGDADVSCHPLKDTRSVEEVTLWQLEMARAGAKVATKTMPVVLTSRAVVGTLAMPLMVGFNGRTVLEGASPLKGKLGEKLLDEKLSLRDDPVTSFLPESRPCDDEGVPSRRTTLVQSGTITSFLYDLQTAGLAGAQSTGSASRSRGAMPSPGPSCLVFEEGTLSIEQMVSEIKEGIVVEHLMGAGQGNVLGGDFSGNLLLGFKIENGAMVGRAKDVMVSGNIYQALKGIVAMGSESRLVHGTVKTPPIWLEGLAVAARG